MLSSYEAVAGWLPGGRRLRGGIPTQAYFGVMIVIAGTFIGRQALAVEGLTQWILLWCAVACALVSVAYLANWPGVFGKRADGTLNHWYAIPVWPYQLFFWLYWQGERFIGRLTPHTEVAPGLYVGRRVVARELPPRVDLVVDLTSEFPEISAIREGRQYRCLPVLDGSVPPSEEELASLLRDIAGHPGSVFVHCASGRGRAVATVAAVMVLRGIATDVADAFDRIRALRPGIRPTPTHREVVARVTAKILREKYEGRIARVRPRDMDGDAGGLPRAFAPAG